MPSIYLHVSEMNVEVNCFATDQPSLGFLTKTFRTILENRPRPLPLFWVLQNTSRILILSLDAT